MKDLLSERLQWGGKDQLYHVLDKLLAHRDALFTHLQERWQDLFGVKYDVLQPRRSNPSGCNSGTLLRQRGKSRR